MAMRPYRNTINNPHLFTQSGIIAAIQSGYYGIWQSGEQPNWPTKNIAYTRDDKYRRRHLIQALTSPVASQDLQNLGYSLFMCSLNYPCKSPLCNYCRTKMQDRYEKRVLWYFNASQRQNIYWLTVLDDVTYNPIFDAPIRQNYLKRKIKRVLENTPSLKTAKAFAAFELDVKSPSQMLNKQKAMTLLARYNMTHPSNVAFMPHFHAIIDLNGTHPDDMRKAFRRSFTKPYQISVSGMWNDLTKQHHLSQMTRYMFKFRYQFADNIMRSKPRYDIRFDDQTMRLYAETILAMTGDRGVRQYELKYNI